MSYFFLRLSKVGIPLSLQSLTITEVHCSCMPQPNFLNSGYFLFLQRRGSRKVQHNQALASHNFITLGKCVSELSSSQVIKCHSQFSRRQVRSYSKPLSSVSFLDSSPLNVYPKSCMDLPLPIFLTQL